MSNMEVKTKETIARSVNRMEAAYGVKNTKESETYEDFEKRVDALTDSIIAEIERLKTLKAQKQSEVMVVPMHAHKEIHVTHAATGTHKEVQTVGADDIRTALEYMSKRFDETEKKIDSIMEIEMLVKELRDQAVAARDFSQQVRKEIAVIKAREETLASQVQEARDVVEKAKGVIDNAANTLPSKKDASASVAQLEDRYFPLIQKAEEKAKAVEKMLSNERKKSVALNAKIKEMDLKNANKKSTLKLISSLRKKVNTLEKTKAAKKVTNKRLTAVRSAIEDVQSKKASRAATGRRLKSVRSKVETVEAERAPKESTQDRLKSVRTQVASVQAQRASKTRTQESLKSIRKAVEGKPAKKGKSAKKAPKAKSSKKASKK